MIVKRRGKDQREPAKVAFALNLVNKWTTLNEWNEPSALA